LLAEIVRQTFLSQMNFPESVAGHASSNTTKQRSQRR